MLPPLDPQIIALLEQSKRLLTLFDQGDERAIQLLIFEIEAVFDILTPQQQYRFQLENLHLVDKKSPAEQDADIAVLCGSHEFENKFYYLNHRIAAHQQNPQSSPQPQ